MNLLNKMMNLMIFLNKSKINCNVLDVQILLIKNLYLIIL
jgi:hypothetical protein